MMRTPNFAGEKSVISSQDKIRKKPRRRVDRRGPYRQALSENAMRKSAAILRALHRPSASRARRRLALAAPAIALAFLGSRFHTARAADIAASWTADSNGSWSSTTNWSTAPNSPRNDQPSAGVTYTATLSSAGPNSYTVTLDDTPFTIDGLTIDSAEATLLQTSGSWTPGPVSVQAGTFNVDGSTSVVNSAVIDVGSSGTLDLSAGELNGGSATADGAGSFIAIQSGFTFAGGATVQALNGGTVELQNGSFINNSSLSTAGANGIFSIGYGAILDNTGATAGSSSTLQPGAGATLQLNGGTISGGTVNSTGGTFYIGNYSTGTLDGTPNGGITLIGALQSDANATTSLQGLINDPNGFTFDSAPSAGPGADYNISLINNIELKGDNTTTTLANSNGGNVFFGSFGLSNLQLTIDNGHTLLSNTSVQSDGAITLVNNGTVQADGPSGLFSMELNTGSVNAGAIKATNGASVVLSLDGTFANSGTMLADGSESQLVIANGSGFSNSASGIFQATNGGTISLENGTIINSGTVLATGAGSTLILSSGFSNIGAGSIQAIDGATLELANGNFVNNSSLPTVGINSTLSIGGAIFGAFFDNTGTTPGSSSNLQPSAGGTLQFDGAGTISGGTVNSTGGTFYDALTGTLDGTPAGGITLIGTLTHNSFATTSLQGLINDPNGFTFDSAPSAGPGASFGINFGSNIELKGDNTTTTLANSNGGNVIFGSFYLEDPQLTIDSGHTLLSKANVLRSDIPGYGAFSLINNGTVQADGANNQFYLALVHDSYNYGTIKATSGALVTMDNFAGGTLFNSGTIEASGGGTITFSAVNLTNTGMIVLHNGTIITYGPLAIGDGTLAGSGTIDGDLTLDSDPSTLAFNLGGLTQFTQYDSLSIFGNTLLAGDLQLTLIDGLLPSSSDAFTVLQVDSQFELFGSFLNVPDGGRLETTDGLGSFQVFYADPQFPNEIVLEDFQPTNIPEPSCIALLATATLAFRRRRTRAAKSQRPPI